MRKVMIWNISFVVCILMIKSAFGDPTTNQVSCELVADISFSYVGRHKTCIMERRTKIDDANASLSSAFNEQICGFRMNLNKKISFLPVKVDEKFPNLVGYSAQFCNIKAIKKENFMNLGKLKSIWLNRNQITIVPTDAFDDLESLQYLGISYNKIRSINGAIFEGKFIYLTKVFLERNKCIDENFFGKSIVELFPRTVNERCGFAESDEVTN